MTRFTTLHLPKENMITILYLHTKFHVTDYLVIFETCSHFVGILVSKVAHSQYMIQLNKTCWHAVNTHLRLDYMKQSRKDMTINNK